MNKPRVIVTRRWPDEVERQLALRFDAQFNQADEPLSEAQLCAAFSQADAVLPTVSDRITAKVLSATPLRARFIGNYGVGFNHIDLEAARARGLVVTNTPDVLTDCTADLAMTLMLMIARRAGEGERHLCEGAWSGWRPTHMMGAKVSGKTLGLIGMGRIGRAVARRAHHGFGMNILFYNRTSVPTDLLVELDAEFCASIDEVVQRADFVSLHCPGGGANRHLIDAERLAMMRPGAFLINTARGDVVDEAALAQALRARQIAGAGLDVYESEPRVSGALIGLDNVVLLPHLGSATHETRVAMGLRVIDNLQAFFDDRMPRDLVQ